MPKFMTSSDGEKQYVSYSEDLPDEYIIPSVWEPPERKPHICPVCYGRGSVSQGFYSDNRQGVLYVGGTAPETCRTYGGGGIVWG